MKIAFVVQRYGLEVCGGAELHCRLVAERLSGYYDIEILTTCARDSFSWENEYPDGRERINNVLVKRFENSRTRDMSEFNKYSKYIFNNPHTISEEERWVDMHGPYCPSLQDYIRQNKDKYDFFIFVGYLYFTTIACLPLVSEKSILIPTADSALSIYLPIYKRVFKFPRAILYNTQEEKKLVNEIFRNEDVLSEVVGIGINLPEDINESRFRVKYNITSPFILYHGRIDSSKNCDLLFNYFIRYKEERNTDLKLVLMGVSSIQIPQHKDIIHIGFVSEQDKFDGIKASKIAVMPSVYESLCMAVLEAMSCEKPVLVNGNCPVLKAHCLNSNGGLYFINYGEFIETLDFLLEKEEYRKRLARNGKTYVNKGYKWEDIINKYDSIFERLVKNNRGGNGMDRFEIKDEGLSVEEIMQQIRDNIRKRSGIDRDLDFLNRNWHPLARGILPSQKRYVGPFITIFKRLIWKLTRAYNTVIFHHQIDFNANIVRLLNNLCNDFTQKYELLSDDLSIYKEFQLKISQNHERLQNHLQQETILQKRRLDTILFELKEKYNLGA